MSFPEPQKVFEVLNILTTPKSPGTLQTKNKGTTENREGFDLILEERLCFFEETICDDKYKSFKQEFENLNIFQEDSVVSVQWKFAQACLKSLHLLEKSLTQAISKFKKAHDLQTEPKELKPSQAPPLSPDTLSIAQQKTVLTTMQFISVLGISPYLQKGVGIPIERKSEFGKMIALSGVDVNISDLKKQFNLLSCVKVLMTCIKCPSLGALILSRHLNDLLAILLQLVYGYQPSDDASATSENLSKKREQEESLENKMDGLQNESASGTQISAANWTPATVVDLVRNKQHIAISQLSLSSDINAHGESNRLLSGDFRNSFTKDELSFCEDSLKEILDRVYQPMLVRELMLLQGGPGPVLSKKGSSVNAQVTTALQRAPVWLRKVCGKLLTDILMKPKGVLNVLKGMLEGEPGTEAARKIMESKTSDWRKCDAVAKVISFCPMKASSLEEYYKTVAPQILELLHYPDKHVARQFLRVACSTISNMMSKCPELTISYIINPILQPLLSCQEPHDINEKQTILVQENRLSLCIEDIHRVFVSGSEPNSPVLKCLKPVCHTVFQLYCFIKEGVSHLRSACHEILVTFLKQSDKDEALCCLKCLTLGSDVESIKELFPRMHCSVAFAHGSNGGVVVVSKSVEDIHTNESAGSLVEPMLEILHGLQKEGLVGDFFLYMLQELTRIITMKIDDYDTKAPTRENTQGEGLLDIEERETQFLANIQNQINILNLLAAICEKIGPSCIKNTKQTLNFVQVTLERAVCICQNTGDEMTLVFESETLTMAMGLLTAVLGGAVEVTCEDREHMKKLLPMLQVISDEHSDSSVQEMASDLRVAIATHGAVWSELMKNSMKFEKIKEEGKKQTQQKPLVEEIKQDPQKLVTETTNLKSENNSDISKADNKISEIQQAFEELCDPLIPVRGHALISLAKLVQDKHQDALDKHEVLLKIFVENLSHPDTYLYLASINGLAGLADIYPDIVIPKIIQEFSRKDSGEGKVSRNAEIRIKMGECLVKATRNLGDMIPKYKDVLLAATLTAAKDPDPSVRASSVSNLGEICKLLKFSLGGVIHEVFTCCSSLLKSDSDNEVRQAAAMTICLLLQGLGKDVLKVLDSVISDLYKLMKFVMTVEKDDSVKLHVTLALNELDTIMRELLFPQQTLQKKIKVLDPD